MRNYTFNSDLEHNTDYIDIIQRVNPGIVDHNSYAFCLRKDADLSITRKYKDSKGKRKQQTLYVKYLKYNENI